ncbi:MAG: DUF3291 domain-containing protein [Actinomycetota bacterium]
MTDPLRDLNPPEAVDSPSPGFVERLRARVHAIEARADRAPQGWHLAQLNLGVFKAPLDAPEMAPFAAALDRINAIADESPGFVWRLTDDDGGPSSNVEVPGSDDPLLASNLSVWRDYDSLREFMYRTDHASYLRRRAEWFERESIPMVVGWWVPAGTVPTLDEALDRLEHLRREGPSAAAFPLTRTIPDPPSTATNQEVPAMGQVFIPYLTVGDSRAALQFYGEVFGAERSGELFEMDDGRIGHAEMTIGDQVFYMADEFAEMQLHAPTAHGGNSVSLVIHVEDCDAVYEHALLAGATGERPPADQHGFRSGWFVDPWGHRWSPTSAATGA